MDEPRCRTAGATGRGDSVPAPRITLLIAGLRAGGAEKVLSGLANHWAERGWACTLITLQNGGAPAFYPLDGRVTVVRLGLEPRRVQPFRAAALMATRLVRLRAAIRSSRPDIVISFMTRVNILALLACAGLRVPVVVSERNNPGEQRVGLVWRLLRRVLYGRADRVTALTSEALEFYPPAIRKKGVVIPNAFEIPSRPAPRTGRPNITAVGRLVEQKGFDLLILAFAEVAGRCPELDLVIWGEGPERGRLERLRDELGLAHRVRMPGLTEEPHAWVRDAHIFVLSSRYEGLANVLGEAMAAGLPVIAFDCDWGPRKFITPGVDGVLVPPQDVGALAEAIVTLACDPTLREELGSAARDSMSRFAPEHILAQWDEILLEALPRRTGHPGHGTTPG